MAQLKSVIQLLIPCNLETSTSRSVASYTSCPISAEHEETMTTAISGRFFQGYNELPAEPPFSTLVPTVFPLADSSKLSVTAALNMDVTWVGLDVTRNIKYSLLQVTQLDLPSHSPRTIDSFQRGFVQKDWFMPCAFVTLVFMVPLSWKTDVCYGLSSKRRLSETQQPYLPVEQHLAFNSVHWHEVVFTENASISITPASHWWPHWWSP